MTVTSTILTLIILAWVLFNWRKIEMKKIKLEISSYYCCRDSCSCHDRRIRSAEFTK